MTKNFCISERGKSITVTDREIPAHWFEKGSPHRIDGNLGRGVWIVDSIGECGPGGTFLILYQRDPVFRIAYVYTDVGLPLLA